VIEIHPTARVSQLADIEDSVRGSVAYEIPVHVNGRTI